MRKTFLINLLIALAVCLTVATSCSNGATIATVTTTATAAKLVFTTQPTGAPAGTLLATQPIVTVEDAAGNTVKNYKAPVTLTITAGTGSTHAVLFGGKTVTPAEGVATFRELMLERAGAGYTLTATSPGLTPANSASFEITPREAAGLSFTPQPRGVTSGSVFTATVSVTDIYGNVVPSATVPVTLSVTPGTIGMHTGPNGTVQGASGLALSGTVTVSAVKGVAVFSDVSINLAGTGFRLTATSGGLASATSATFNISPGAATTLAFGLQPIGGAPGAEFTLPPVVWVEDACGNICEPSTPPAAVTISIITGTGTAGAVLSGNTTDEAFSAAYQSVPASAVAGFSDISINLLGTGYRLTATSSGLTPATSDPFDVSNEPQTVPATP
jgi:hypothetical protein